jgi:hypothetical protein
MASKGRDGDSMLVHMTPGEVHGLQALAMKHGGSLTTNPDTGLPEANFLKSLLPMLAGFALGPAGFGLVSSAMGAGAIVGGITGIATGSLSKGLMAGLGAYGGFGIGESLAGVGANAMGDAAASSAYGASAGMTDVAAQELGFASAEEAAQNAAAQAAKSFDPSQVAGFDKATTGFNTATSSGSAALDFAKNNKLALGMAAAPIMADMMVPTTTKSAPVQSPGRIREKIWDGRQFIDVGNTDAGVYNTSGRSFSDLYRGYNGGGIVALAGGGDVKHFAIGDLVKADIDKAYAAGDYARVNELAQANKITASDVAETYKGFDASGLAGLGINLFAPPAVQTATTPTPIVQATTAADTTATPSALTPMVDTSNVGNRIAEAQTSPMQGASTYVATAAANPNITSSEFMIGANNVGLQGQALIDAMQRAGLSQSAQYALTHNLNDAVGIVGASKPVQDFYNSFGYVAGDLKGDAGGLAGLYTNISQVAGKLQDEINKGNLTIQQAQNMSLAEMERLGISQADIKAATGKAFGDLFAYKKPDPFVSVTPGEVKLPKATTYDNGAFGNYGSGNVTGVDSNGKVVSIATPGDIITNADGTRTTVPNVPGRPYGGFTGMEGVRSAYTAGGGSLGYTSPVPTSLEAFNKTYVTDRMSDDSLAAYNYLTGKKGAKYPVKSGVGQIARPYDEAVLGYPARGNLPYTYDKDTGKMVRNMDYVAPGRDAAGNVTYSMSLNDAKKVLTDTPLSGQALYDWAKTNNLSAQNIADATGRSLSSVYADFRIGSKAAADKKAVTNADGTVDEAKVAERALADEKEYFDEAAYLAKYPDVKNELTTGKSASGQPVRFTSGYDHYMQYVKGKGSTTHSPIFKSGYTPPVAKASGGIMGYAMGGMPGYALGGLGTLGGYSDGGRLLRGPGDGVSDSIPATIGRKQQPARLADGEFVVPARIVSELGNGSTDAGAKKLYAMMDRVQRARGKTTGKNKVAANSRADKYLPA